MRSPWIIQMGPKRNESVMMRDAQKGHTEDEAM